MEYRRLGRWGVKVSAVGLGTWLYGTRVDEATARTCVDRAFELGVNFFDTADMYHQGRAEEILGSALARHPRDSFVLASKVCGRMGPGPNDAGLSRKHVARALVGSLQRLGTDHLDLYQCHRFDPEVPLEEICRVMDDLIRAGKVLYWGVSEWPAHALRRTVELCEARGWSPPVSDQVQYSALWRSPEEEIRDLCGELGVGLVAWSPLAKGVLSGKYTSTTDLPADSRARGEDAEYMRQYFNDDVLAAVRRVKAVGDRVGATTAQLALAWCLSRDAVSSVVIGATRAGHVDDNAGAGTFAVPDEAIREVDEILEPVHVRPALED
jgi:aryl-alcohol dehydrogenase-like predicted oxidoreductase